VVKKGEKLSEEHKRRIGEGVRRQSAWSAEARAAYQNLAAEGVKADEGVRREIEQMQADKDALLALRKYIGDLSFVAPEVFPTAQTVQYRVGQILGLWK